MDILEGLNESQVEAVMTKSGPLLLLAGAGSGKTKTLTHRIAHLLANEQIWPSQILAVTFTNKAAKEMRQRLWSLTNATISAQPDRGFMPWMGTFHGICVRMLRLEGQAIDIQPNFIIYDEDDRQGLIKQVMKELAISSDKVKPRAVSAAISTAKNEMVGAEQYRETAQYPFQKTVADIYLRYETLRQQAGALDFDDLLIETVRLLRQSTETRAKYRQQFSHIFIDEYQDTNAAQYAIVKLLVNQSKNICVVGDDWQSIYSWRGADFTNILNFEKDFPGAKVVKLEQNYRSTSSILEAAHNVITKNTERTDKKLWTDEGVGAPVSVQAVYNEAEEAYMVMNRIKTQVDNGSREAGDFAILYRTNAQSFAFERTFLQHHVPYQIIGGVRFYDRKEIKDILAYLRLVYQPNDRVSFSRIFNIPTRGIGAKSFEKFINWQAISGLDIIAALANAELIPGLTARAKNSFLQLAQILRSLQAMVFEDASASEIIEAAIRLTGYRDFIKDGSPQAEERDDNLGVLVSDAKIFAHLADFLEEAALMSSVDASSEDQKVTLMTLHAAKGLEFPVVFMVGMEDGLFPSSRALEAGPRQLEEERRLCYVGMTRARQELHLSYAQSRSQFGTHNYATPSRFLDDMGYEVIKKADNLPSSNDFDDIVNDFDIGDAVKSQQFGLGEIIDLDGLAVTVRFLDGTVKKLNIEFARLERIEN